MSSSGIVGPEDFRDLLDLIVADVGCLVSLAVVYVDESGTHDGSPVMSIGGFIFSKRNAREFSRKWSAFLRAKGVPYFHMKDVTNPHGKIYRAWTDDQLLNFEKKLIDLIGKHSEAGFAVSVSESDFVSEFGDAIATADRQETMRSAYTYLLQNAISQGMSWAESLSFAGGISYFFEAGHKHQGRTSHLIEEIMTPMRPDLAASFPWMEESRLRHRYVSHTFMDKTQAPPLQAADLLAWLWRNAVMKRMKSEPERRDLTALRSKVDIRTIHYDASTLRLQREFIMQLFRVVTDRLP